MIRTIYDDAWMVPSLKLSPQFWSDLEKHGSSFALSLPSPVWKWMPFQACMLDFLNSRRIVILEANFS